uniref:Homeobox domain-containing protein n=1 Tax=Kalanchoe fedtschenkoi TaxID=63787 RepID=A0A7N0V068_KALFE
MFANRTTKQRSARTKAPHTLTHLFRSTTTTFQSDAKFTPPLDRDHQQPLMPEPDHEMPSRYQFRFTRDEVAEMENLMKENASLPAEVAKALALKFSKTRHERGQSNVRSDSVNNWFKKRRHVISKANRALSSVRSSRPSILSTVAKIQQSPMPFQDKLQSEDEEASSKESSEEKSAEEGNFGEGTLGPIVPSSTISNSVEILDQMDVSPQPLPSRENPKYEVDGVLARLAKFRTAQLSQHTGSTPSLALSDLDMVNHAKATLEKLEGISLVDFSSYRSDFDMAIRILVEKGSPSDVKKTELLLLQEQVHEIAKAHVQAREELSKCNDFTEKLTEASETTDKLMKKAVLLEEKYNKIPQDLSAVSRKISELEAALVQAKTELEIMRGDQDDVSNELAKLRESLESVYKHMKSLKAEEAGIIKKRVETEEALEKSTEEWVRLTHLKAFTVI